MLDHRDIGGGKETQAKTELVKRLENAHLQKLNLSLLQNRRVRCHLGRGWTQPWDARTNVYRQGRDRKGKQSA